MVHLISINASSAQKSKLRNGHKVRVKHGAGFNLIVSPTSYHLVSRAFNRNKGVTLQLTPEEIEMNRAPTPELQSQLLGHKQHMVLPGVVDHMGGRGLGSGVKEFFQNIGNKIKGGFDTIKEKVIDPVKDLYEKNVPADIRRDVRTAMKFTSPVDLITSTAMRLKRGDKIQDIGRDYFEDLKHLNETKNKIIKSSPALTEAYKKGVMATAGLGSAAIGTTLGLNPATGALLGAAGAKGAQELLKAEGYGLHHAIEHGEKHHYDELKHHSRPIGGKITFKGIKDFFVNAGRKLAPVVKQGAQTAHNFILANPELAKKIKEHGSKLAGMLAKMGANYLTGDEKYGEQAEKLGSKFGEEQIHKNLGYGLSKGPHRTNTQAIMAHNQPPPPPAPLYGKGIDPISQLIHAIDRGAHHHYHELKHHHRPIGGALKLSHIKNFFTNAGRHIHHAVKAVAPEVHKFILNNPELGKKIKEHGSKLAGMLAKMGANYLTGDEKYGDQAEAFGSKLADEQIHKNLGYGLGTGLYAGRQMGKGIPEPHSRLIGGGFNSYESLYDANMGYSNALNTLSKMSDRTVRGQHEAEPIKRYWDADGQPPSRGYGLKRNHHAKVHHARISGFERGNHYNLVRGRGSLLEHRSVLPPALQSQPYGANFNMQNMLPPQYHKYNDGTNEY